MDFRQFVVVRAYLECDIVQCSVYDHFKRTLYIPQSSSMFLSECRTGIAKTVLYMFATKPLLIIDNAELYIIGPLKHGYYINLLVICTKGTLCSLLLACLESAYSLICGALRIWQKDLGTFMISRPI